MFEKEVTFEGRQVSLLPIYLLSIGIGITYIFGIIKYFIYYNIIKKKKQQ